MIDRNDFGSIFPILLNFISGNLNEIRSGGLWLLNVYFGVWFISIHYGLCFISVYCCLYIVVCGL
jgi:hypothetical protein